MISHTFVVTVLLIGFSQVKGVKIEHTKQVGTISFVLGAISLMNGKFHDLLLTFWIYFRDRRHRIEFPAERVRHRT